MAGDVVFTLEVADEGADFDLAGGDFGVGADGGVTAALHSGQNLPFGRSRCSGLRIVDGGDELVGPLVVGPGLDGQGALGGGGDKFRRIENERDSIAQAKPLQARPRQQDRVELARIELLQSRLHVTPKRRRLDVGSEMPELCGASQAGGADLGTSGQLVQRVHRRAGDQAIFDKVPIEYGGDGQALALLGGQVLEAVDGEVGLAGGQDLFELRGEEARVLEAPQGRAPVTVAAGGDLFDFDFEMRMNLLQRGGDELSLSDGQRPAAGYHCKNVHRNLSKDPSDESGRQIRF